MSRRSPAESTVSEGRRLKRLLLTTGNYVNVVDGVALTTRRLVAHLEARGVHVVVLAPDARHRRLEPEGDFWPVRSVPLPPQPEYRVALAPNRAMFQRLEAFGPQLVHVASPDSCGSAVIPWARARRLPVVGSYHSDFVSYLRYRPPLGVFTGWARRRLGRIYGACDEVYAPTQTMIEVLKRRGISSRLVEWSRGVDVERFSPERRDATWRARWPAKGPAVLFVSRLVMEKGLRRLVEVAERLRASGRPHVLVVVGDGPARGWLERALPQAHFLGHLEGQELARAYASADVFLNPSDTETFGNVTLEAMASGLPVVVADALGSRSLVDESLGRRVSPARPEQWVEALGELLDDAGLRERLGARALERARARDWVTINDGLLQRYEAILARRASRAQAATMGA